MKKLARLLAVRVSRMEVAASCSFEGFWLLLDVDAVVLLGLLLLLAWMLLGLWLRVARLLDRVAYVY
jgi:hypothetical protein